MVESLWWTWRTSVPAIRCSMSETSSPIFVGHRDPAISIRADNCKEFHEAIRRAALERFKWSARSLALREAVCLFRICTNVIRHPKRDWKSKLDAGLELVLNCLD